MAAGLVCLAGSLTLITNKAEIERVRKLKQNEKKVYDAEVSERHKELNLEPSQTLLHFEYFIRSIKATYLNNNNI